MSGMMSDLAILYRDEYLVAVHKPAGLLVHKTHIDQHETLNAMHILRDQLGQWVYPVHRLDRPTSGVLLFALDASTAKVMGEQFAQCLVNKTYQAIVRGYTPWQALIDHPLKPTADFKSQRRKVAQKPAQAAQTAYTCLGQLELPYTVDKYPCSRYSLLELRPKTGRKHQLRKHLKHISHPIIGDPKYGKSRHNHFFKQHFDCHRLLLAATQLHFFHPVTEKPVNIQAEIEGVLLLLSQQFIQPTE